MPLPAVRVVRQLRHSSGAAELWDSSRRCASFDSRSRCDLDQPSNISVSTIITPNGPVNKHPPFWQRSGRTPLGSVRSNGRDSPAFQWWREDARDGAWPLTRARFAERHAPGNRHWINALGVGIRVGAYASIVCERGSRSLLCRPRAAGERGWLACPSRVAVAATDTECLDEWARWCQKCSACSMCRHGGVMIRCMERK